MQVFDCEYPHETNTLSPEEKLCMESEYYIRVLLRNYGQESEEEEDTSIERRAMMLDSDPPDTVFIKLNELLVFQSIRRLTADVDNIRYAWLWV